MSPTHKPEDGDRAPISNRGAELETRATEAKVLVRLLNQAAWASGNAETADYIRLNNLGGMDNQCMKLARAALSQPHPHGG